MSNSANGAAGQPVRLGIAGLGRSGWNIHAATAQRLDHLYDIVAVQDLDADRRREAEESFNCRSYKDLDDMLADDEVEVVVVATPNHLHGPHSMAALAAGKNVVCEKPMATSLEEADAMLEAERASAGTLAIFQNRRFDALFTKIREIIDSGALGRIVQIRNAHHSFARRWDWQTIQEFGGGTLNNTAPHFMDQVLQLFKAEDPEVFCHLDRTLTVGDADDHVVVMLRGENEPLTHVEITSACAYPIDLWLVMGTSGTLRASMSHVEWKTVDWSKMPHREPLREAAPDRAYLREDLEWQEHRWDMPDEQKGAGFSQDEYYRALHRFVRQGGEVPVSAADVRRQILILDRCREQSPLEPALQ